MFLTPYKNEQKPNFGIQIEYSNIIPITVANHSKCAPGVIRLECNWNIPISQLEYNWNIPVLFQLAQSCFFKNIQHKWGRHGSRRAHIERAPSHKPKEPFKRPSGLPGQL